MHVVCSSAFPCPPSPTRGPGGVVGGGACGLKGPLVGEGWAGGDLLNKNAKQPMRSFSTEKCLYVLFAIDNRLNVL